MRDTQIPFWILAVAFGAAFMLPQLAGEGVHFDGEIYATLARNLAEGRGEPWAPYLNASDPIWNEHPPLGLWIMSIPYRVFGDPMWVEKLYSLLTVLACGWLIVLLWRRIFRDDARLAALGWLPLLMWFGNPQVPWAYRNAMLENTSSLFVLVGLYALVRAWQADRFPWSWTMGAGLALAGAIFTKGAVGLYPLGATVLATAIAGRPRWPRAIGITLVVGAAVAAMVGLVLSWPAARQNLDIYLAEQFMRSLDGSRGSRPSLFELPVKLFETHLVALILAVLLAAGARWRFGAAAGRPPWRTGILWLAIGLAGSLPLGISPRQSLFYCLPAFPAYAVGFAALAAPGVRAWTDTIRPGGIAHRVWLGVGSLLLAAVIVYSATRLDDYARNPEWRADIGAICDHLTSVDPGNRAYGLCSHLEKDWTMQATFSRYGNFDPVFTADDQRWLVCLPDCGHPDAPGWVRQDLGTTKIQLYQRVP